MIPGIGIGELVIVFLVVLLLFGAKRVPEIGRSLGASIREFRAAGRELRGVEREWEE